jgi:hypothetical protein
VERDEDLAVLAGAEADDKEMKNPLKVNLTISRTMLKINIDY